MALSYEIALPTEGYFLREFIITALAFISQKSGAKLTVNVDKAILEVPSLSRVATSYAALIRQFHQVESIFVTTDHKAPKQKIITEISRLTNKKASTPSEAMINYAEWVESEASNVNVLLSSLAKLTYPGPGEEGVLYYGENRKRLIAAPQILKANFSYCKRVFGKPSKAEVKLDIHALSLALTGALIARVGVRREERRRVTIYLSLLDPGAYNFWNETKNILKDVECRTAPEVIFRVLLAFKLKVPGILPMRFFEIESGMKPLAYSYHEVAIDRGLVEFVNNLPEYCCLQLINLFMYALRNWREPPAKTRPILITAYKLALAIYMTTGGLMKPGEMLYSVARDTYATVGKEFEEALKNAKIDIDLEDFEKLIRDIYESLT